MSKTIGLMKTLIKFLCSLINTEHSHPVDQKHTIKSPLALYQHVLRAVWSALEQAQQHAVTYNAFKTGVCLLHWCALIQLSHASQIMPYSD